MFPSSSDCAHDKTVIFCSDALEIIAFLFWVNIDRHRQHALTTCHQFEMSVNGAMTVQSAVIFPAEVAQPLEGIFISFALIRRIKKGLLCLVALVVAGLCARYIHLIQQSTAHNRRHVRNPLIALALWCQGASHADPPQQAGAKSGKKCSDRNHGDKTSESKKTPNTALRNTSKRQPSATDGASDNLSDSSPTVGYVKKCKKKKKQHNKNPHYIGSANDVVTQDTPVSSPSRCSTNSLSADSEIGNQTDEEAGNNQKQNRQQQEQNRFACLTSTNQRTKQHIARMAHSTTNNSNSQSRNSNTQSPAPESFSLPHHEKMTPSGNAGKEASYLESPHSSAAAPCLHAAGTQAVSSLCNFSAGGVSRAKKPSFILLMGISGSGKSTWANQYVAQVDPSFRIVSSDEIRLNITGSIDDQNSNTKVWEVVLADCVEALNSGCNVILDATNLQTERRRRFLHQLPCCTRYQKLFPIHKSVAKHRIEKDLAAGKVRSATPDSIIDLMARQFQDSLAAVREEGWKMK